jgi:glutathione peroxidase-family protein
MYEKHEKDGLRVAAFPCNQFGGQEPWPESEIKKYVADNFHATFDLYAKLEVNGDNAHPLWKYLKNKQGGTLGDFIKWNFSKFVIDRHGIPVKRYGPQTTPNEMEKDIAEMLKQ